LLSATVFGTQRAVFEPGRCDAGENRGPSPNAHCDRLGLPLSIHRRRGRATYRNVVAQLAQRHQVIYLTRREWDQDAPFDVPPGIGVGWMTLPAVWMGVAPWWQAQREWSLVAVASAAGHPSGGAKESEARVQNRALRPVLARYCPPSPALVAAAGNACPLPAVVLTALVALFAWWMRDPSVRRDDLSWLVQCSAVLILSALLSPVTWTQHLVVVIPALYAIAAAQRGGPGLGPASSAGMGVYFALAVLLNREVLGRERYVALLAYGVHSLSMLIVLGVLVRVALEGGRRAAADRPS